MSRGPGKIERRMRAMLVGPSRLSFTFLELIREAFEVDDYETLTEAERSSGAQALRRILVGGCGEWRISSDRPPGMNGNARLFVRVGLAPTCSGKTAIWAYRFGERSVEWKTAAIMRRTREGCTVRLDGMTLVTDAALRPIEGSEWMFVSVRSAEAESRANAAHRAWLAGKGLPGGPEPGELPALSRVAPISEAVRAAREALRETRARLDEWLSGHNFYLDDAGVSHLDKKLPADLAAAYRRAISSRDITLIYALCTKLVEMLDRLERQHHDFNAPMREIRAERRRREFAVMPPPDC